MSCKKNLTKRKNSQESLITYVKIPLKAKLFTWKFNVAAAREIMNHL